MTLATERLLLRMPCVDDLDGLMPIFADAEVVRFTSGITRTRAEAAARIARWLKHWDDHGVGMLVVERPADRRVLGRVGFLVWDAATWRHGLDADLEGVPVETELGWTLAQEHWGRGYATEAAIACRDWALGERGLRRLISLIQVGNERSKRVAAKLGMTIESVVEREVGGPTEIWSLP